MKAAAKAAKAAAAAAAVAAGVEMAAAVAAAAAAAMAAHRISLIHEMSSDVNAEMQSSIEVILQKQGGLM